MTQKNIEMKRVYQKPLMKVHQLAINRHLLQGSETLPQNEEESLYQW